MKHLIKTTILMLAILLPAIAHAHNFEVDGIYYNINGNEATVTYKGIEFDSYSNEYSGSVTIPATITYRGTTYSVTAIGTYAFFSCDSLTNIDIPNSVTNIGNGAFQSCYGLTSINIPNSVTNIGDGAFSDCYGLTNINIPNSVTNIGEGAFYYCYNLTYINIPNSVTAIGNNAFSITDWERNQPDGLVYAGLVAYEYKGTMPEGTSITLKEGTTGIAGGAFENCHGLTNINIPNSVTNIGKNAFYGCSNLTNINISNSVTAIGANAFYGTVWYSNQPDGLVYAGSVAYKYKGTMPEGTSITLKEGTTEITSKAFYGCSNLTSINIPNSVTNIGDGAFWYCNSLTNINIPNSITNISEHTFTFCSSLNSINIPNSVTNIGDYAFSGCSSLNSINIPNSVTNIGWCAFHGTAWYNNQSDGLVYAGLFAYCYKGTMPEETCIILKEGTIGIVGGAFGECTGLTNINIPNSVTNIGPASFSGCSGLTSIYIPNSVSYIEDDTFGDCFNLINVYLSSSVNTIVHNAFNGCDSIMNVYCFAATPPVIYINGATFTSTRATLHVPAASLGVYFIAPISDYFENIVGDAIEPTGISISRDSVEIQSGGQIKLNATVTPANASCKDVIWYSTDPNVATVENGIVTAVGYGECDIFAYCMGMPAICHITVTNRISLEQQEAMLLPNHMLTLNPTAPVMPAGFTVTSSDPTVAAARVINGKVQIVGIKEGATTITVTSSDGTATPATCLVTVYTEPGDMNCDGFVRISDVSALINYLLSGDETGFKVANADLNHDSKVSIADVTALINILLTTETE